MKHDGGSIMVWRCFPWNGVGPIQRIDGNLNMNKYIAIINNVMQPWAKNNIPVVGQFQQDNDLMNATRMAKRFLQDNSIPVPT